MKDHWVTYMASSSVFTYSVLVLKINLSIIIMTPSRSHASLILACLYKLELQGIKITSGFEGLQV